MRRLQRLMLMLTLMTLFGCDGNGQIVKKPDALPAKTIEPPNSKPAAKIGEPFTLKMNESAKVAGANLEITVNRIGRKWLANGGGESLDFNFSVKHDGKVESYSHPLPDSITAGKYQVETVKTEPFGDGYAIFLVTKKDSSRENESSKKPDSTDAIAAKFVESFGWHLDETIAPTKTALEFPKNFDGLPFYHYQLASKNSGIDMTPLLGKTVEMLKYTLQEKQPTRGSEITNFAHLIIENGAVTGAWRTDSSGAAPGIYSFEKK